MAEREAAGGRPVWRHIMVGRSRECEGKWKDRRAGSEEQHLDSKRRHAPGTGRRRPAGRVGN